MEIELIQDGTEEQFYGRCLERLCPCLLSHFLFSLSRVTYRSWTWGMLQGLCLVQPTVPGHRMLALVGDRAGEGLGLDTRAAWALAVLISSFP